ncbi:MAG: heat-inducible transcriptional repressor HrcA [Ignavibacteria bacterium]
METGLSEREKTILRHIIEDFIKTATPVGSRNISKKSKVRLSPATIRNVMSDLEGLSLITHPHTSGGRVPTDKGYRYFVNELMEVETLKPVEKSKIKRQFDEIDLSSDEIFKEVSRILGKLTHEISIVSQPYFSEGVFEKLELINLSSSKVLVVVSIQSGLVRTLIFDIESQIKRDKLDRISRILNERLGGLTLKEIRKTYIDRIGSLRNEDTGIVKVFIDSIDKIFDDEKEGMTLYIGGTIEILSQPEFGDSENYKNIIELTDDKNVVFHVLNSLPIDESGTAISIGGENKDEKLKTYSIVSTTYSAGDVTGKIAVIGPKRMNYSKMLSLLNYTSKIITEKI